MSGTRAILLTARRELRERLRSRAFRVSVLIQVLIVLAVVVISGLSGGDDTTDYSVGTSGAEATALVARISDRSAPGVSIDASEVADSGETSRSVSDGDLDAALVDRDLITGPQTDEELIGILQAGAGRAETVRMLEVEGLGRSRIEAVLSPEPLQVTEVGEDRASADGIAFIGSLLLYIGILGFGFIVTSGIVEEKSSRVVELILSTIRPAQLLAGKIIGIGLLGILQLAVTAVVGIGAAMALGEVELPSSTAKTTLLVLLYFVLGYALYACAFAVAGAIVSRQEDVGSVTTPLTIVLVAGYLASFSITEDPTGTLATVCTFIPPIAPLIVPARAAVDALPLGELLASVALMIAATVALVGLAGRIYERAVLRVGAPMRLIDGLKLARRSAD